MISEDINNKKKEDINKHVNIFVSIVIYNVLESGLEL